MSFLSNPEAGLIADIVPADPRPVMEVSEVPRASKTPKAKPVIKREAKPDDQSVESAQKATQAALWRMSGKRDPIAWKEAVNRGNNPVIHLTGKLAEFEGAKDVEVVSAILIAGHKPLQGEIRVGDGATTAISLKRAFRIDDTVFVSENHLHSAEDSKQPFGYL